MAFFISTNDSVVKFDVVSARFLFTVFFQAQWAKFLLHAERLSPKVLERSVTDVDSRLVRQLTAARTSIRAR
jgi:hypothetical protein